jgi:hypothetical protein
MRQLVDYVDQLGHDADIAVRFVTEEGVMVRYALVLLVEDGGQIWAVRVFDNTHGQHDMHRYTRTGEKLPAEQFHRGSPSEAMNAALKSIRTGWRGMVESWRR